MTQEAHRKRCRRYRERHREEVLRRGREWAKAHYVYRPRTPEERAYQKAWTASNKDRKRLVQETWNAAHIEERRAYLRAYKRAMVSVAGECLNFNPYPELREVAILLGQLRRAFKTQKGAQS